MEELEKINEKVKTMLQEVFDFALENVLKKLEEKGKKIFEENLIATQEVKNRIENLKEEMEKDIREIKKEFTKLDKLEEEIKKEIERQFTKLDKIYKNKFLLAIILFSISLLINVIILIKIFLK